MEIFAIYFKAESHGPSGAEKGERGGARQWRKKREENRRLLKKKEQNGYRLLRAHDIEEVVVNRKEKTE